MSCTQNNSTLSTLPVEISCCQFVRPFPLSSFRFLSRHFGDNMTVVRETDMLTSTWAQRTRPGPRTVSLQAYRQRICFLMVVAWKRAHIRRSGLQFLSRNCWTPWRMATTRTAMTDRSSQPPQMSHRHLRPSWRWSGVSARETAHRIAVHTSQRTCHAQTYVYATHIA